MESIPRVNSEVITPAGEGTVQGRMRDEDGNLWILVAHGRKQEHTLIITGVWVLREYKLEEVQPC